MHQRRSGGNDGGRVAATIRPGPDVWDYCYSDFVRIVWFRWGRQPANPPTGLRSVGTSVPHISYGIDGHHSNCGSSASFSAAEKSSAGFESDYFHARYAQKTAIPMRRMWNNFREYQSSLGCAQSI